MRDMRNETADFKRGYRRGFDSALRGLVLPVWLFGCTIASAVGYAVGRAGL